MLKKKSRWNKKNVQLHTGKQAKKNGEMRKRKTNNKK